MGHSFSEDEPTTQKADSPEVKAADQKRAALEVGAADQVATASETETTGQQTTVSGSETADKQANASEAESATQKTGSAEAEATTQKTAPSEAKTAEQHGGNSDLHESQDEVQRPRKKRAQKAALCVGTALLLFGSGMYVGMKNALNLELGFPVVSQSEVATGQPMGEQTTELARRLVEATQLIDSQALDEHDLETATKGSISGLLASLNDDYAHYYTPEDYRQMLEENQGEFGGIGVVLSERNGQAYIVSVYDDTPAAKAGLKAGDVIVEVNGVRKEAWSTEDLARAIRAQAGTNVELSWISVADDGTKSEEKRATLQTAEIHYPVVSSRMDGNIGIITVTKFNNNSQADVAAAVESLTNQGAQGLILDLRGNPGGPLAQAVAVSSEFISGGTVVEVKTRTSGSQRENATGKPITNLPLVVLVDRDSASTAEIVTSAIQDHQRGLIVGELTFGKGSVQIINDLSFGGGIKFTIAHYVTPDGHEVNNQGILPDLIVPMDRTRKNNAAEDTQLSAAKNLIGKVIASGGDLNVDGLSNSPGAQPELTKEAREQRTKDYQEIAKQAQEAERSVYEKLLKAH